MSNTVGGKLGKGMTDALGNMIPIDSGYNLMSTN